MRTIRVVAKQARLRHLDFPQSGSVTSLVPEPIEVELGRSERVASVETLKDLHGYATIRVWIAKDPTERR